MPHADTAQAILRSRSYPTIWDESLEEEEEAQPVCPAKESYLRHSIVWINKMTCLIYAAGALRRNVCTKSLHRLVTLSSATIYSIEAHSLSCAPVGSLNLLRAGSAHLMIRTSFLFSDKYLLLVGFHSLLVHVGLHLPAFILSIQEPRYRSTPSFNNLQR